MNKEKEIILKKGWSLTKNNTGTKYMFTGRGVFIHGNEIEFTTISKNGAWLNIMHNGVYIGSIFIDTTNKIKEVNKFIKE